MKKIVCPKCKNYKFLLEVSDGVVDRHSFEWDTKQKTYVWKYQDSDNYGETNLECHECGYKFNSIIYSKFANNCITKE